MGVPVILSYGMGVDSSALLARWLLEPSSRDFALRDLVVLTAQTGDEFVETARQVNQYMLPLLRAHGVRFVQVARAGLHQTAGTTVLADSREPRRVELDGDYRLSDEMLTQGTVPQYQSGRRMCSIHAKGWPLDATIAAVLEGETFAPGQHLAHTEPGSDRPFRHVIGFNANEVARARRDSSYSEAKFVRRQSWYPLIEWGWGRRAVEEYLYELVGERWLKSCCVYCPFTGARAEHIERLEGDPDDAVFSLLIEYCSLAFNPNQPLHADPRPKGERWAGKSLWSALDAADQADILADFEADLDDKPWGIYHVRRIPSPAARSLVDLGGGLGRDEALAELASISGELDLPITVDRRQGRIWIRARIEDVALLDPTGRFDVDFYQAQVKQWVWSQVGVKVRIGRQDHVLPADRAVRYRAADADEWERSTLGELAPGSEVDIWITGKGGGWKAGTVLGEVLDQILEDWKPVVPAPEAVGGFPGFLEQSDAAAFVKQLKAAAKADVETPEDRKPKYRRRKQNLIDLLRSLTTTEELIVAAPNFAVTKTPPGFERRWENVLVSDQENRDLYDVDWIPEVDR